MNRIRETRVGKGLSQKQVALEVGVKSPSVSNWESGKTTPTPENYMAMARLFNVSVDYLMGIDTRDERSQALNDGQNTDNDHSEPPINPHTYYAQKFGDETQEIVDHFLDLMASMPDEKSRLKTAEGAVTLAHGILAECEHEGNA